MTYKLINNCDPNHQTDLDSITFQDALEEALESLEWYVIDEGDDGFIGVNDTDPNDTIDLCEQEREDAQYELLEQLGYFISERQNEEEDEEDALQGL